MKLSSNQSMFSIKLSDHIIKNFFDMFTSNLTDRGTK